MIMAVMLPFNGDLIAIDSTSDNFTLADTFPAGSSATPWTPDMMTGVISSGNGGTSDNDFLGKNALDNTMAVTEAEEGPTNDDSENTDEDISEQPKVTNVSERRREQHKKFSSWLSQRAEKTTKVQVREAVLSADDEALSIRNLMSKQESNVIITNPRDYQVELFEKAKRQNVIAVLDTGSGKTLIAVLLLRHILDQELEDRAMGMKPRISFFLVDCVTLVFQQFAVLECNLDQKIERFCGEMGCDLWNKGIWETHFKENMVIVCTADILYQCLMHSFIALHQINLLIFDEAHHAKKNHAYARLVVLYRQ